MGIHQRGKFPPTPLPVACEVTKGLEADTRQFLPLLANLVQHHPELVARCESVAADKADDDTMNIVQAKAEHGIYVLCPTWKQWKGSDQQTVDGEGRTILLKLLPGRRNEGLCYDQDGQLYCWHEEVDSGKCGHYPMSLKGYEADRESLKYL